MEYLTLTRLSAKSDLINDVAKVLETKKDAQTAVDSVFAAITQAMKNEDTVTIIGFGTFKVSKRPARTAVGYFLILFMISDRNRNPFLATLS